MVSLFDPEGTPTYALTDGRERRSLTMIMMMA
jgi:hypothetical protein